MATSDMQSDNIKSFSSSWSRSSSCSWLHTSPFLKPNPRLGAPSPACRGSPSWAASPGWEEASLHTCSSHSWLTVRYGPLFALYLGPHYTVVVNNHQHAREVLLQRGKDFAGRPSMVTTNLLTRGGKDIAFSDYSPLWKSHRRLVHNSFTLFGEGTSRLQDIVLSSVDSLCAELLSSGGRGLDPSPAVTRAVTNVVCTLVFSATYRRGDAELQEVIRYNDGIVQTIARGGLVDIYPWMKVFPNESLSKLKECITVRDRLLTRKLEEHKASLSEGDPRDLLDALLKGQTGSGRGQRSSESEDEGITDDHVLMIAAEAFGAGVETTSTTLLWILAYLLHHPEVQERVQKELDEHVGGERAVCMSDRGQLPYLDCVINEGMRIRPVSPVLIPHTAMTDSSIGGHSVSRGTRVLVNMWSIHHDPQHWDKPDLFSPDRFLDDQGQRVTPSCFLPFGAGPRVCIGESLARLELFLFLSSLLQRMSFRLPDGASPPNLQGRLGVVLQPLPYKVVVSPRSGWQGGAK
ncbi:steroid 17-alpha-hydroxylase/17,20 lyase isoform X2 [Thunnus maccoyii]|uniref:steroid 17-alpha-hydroxylase/17,20 lyase isoform X2 n=1 Tax=Thunnus maccoyii TaxID=8240 RepID=UPI001C4DCEFA|nr:steroid 17-alpha-hydroxylase/17,20 lyase isoform X2 [Thunnus maccoyii]XP_042257670.1 steroid 17-alpha-hydroxylase/17,20 lyase isoform X2 [Thunnus maccoyii]XP_042257671.1 steroid 17-alpha-hydroxylase/17,20 lyase isoform X2 [Thunnus maccoyii]